MCLDSSANRPPLLLPDSIPAARDRRPAQRTLPVSDDSRNGSDAAEPGRRLWSTAAWAFAAFVYAGSFKAYPRLSGISVDLTVLFAVLSCVLIAGTLRYRRALLGPQFFLLVLFFGVCAVVLLWTEPTDYATYKTGRMFTLTLWAALGASLLFRSETAVRSFRNAVIVLGTVSLFEAFAGAPGDGNAQMQLLSADTISTGRLAALCASFLWIGVLQSHRMHTKALQLALMVAFVVLVQAAGARGPALGLLAALFVVSLRLVKVRSKAFFRLSFAAIVLVFAIQSGLSYAPTMAAARLTEFYSGETDWFMTARPELFVEAVNGIIGNPLGLGWGGFEKMYLGSAGTGVWPPVRSYPHNLLLEVTLEGGWIAGALLILTGVVAFRRVWRYATLDVSAIVLAGLLITSMGVLFSGDFNDNRDYFAYVGMALAIHTTHQRAPARKSGS